MRFTSPTSSPTPIQAPTPIRKNRDKLRFAPWSPQFPVRRPSSFAVQAVAPAPSPPSPASTDRTLSVEASPASTLKNDTDRDDQMSFSVTPSRTLRSQNDKRSFIAFTTLASTYPRLASITLDSASEAPGTGSSVEEYRPKGADV